MVICANTLVEYIPLEFFHWNLLFPLFLSTLLRERERASESKRSESEEEEEEEEDQE